MVRARGVALYLPQFHPIPENDAWWGKGFTEWTNTAKALPRFRGHYQPHLPADLGFYDLRLPEARAAQAEMARNHGIEGFCYYHYWFGGRRLLHRPFDEMLASGEPDFPFCVCWANETWSGVWHGLSNKILIEQIYPGEDDHRAHFALLAPAFHDRRYIRVADKPVFVVYQPGQLPDTARTLELWRRMAQEAGLPGLHIVAHSMKVGEDLTPLGFDAMMRVPGIKERAWRNDWRDPVARVRQSLYLRLGRPLIHDYATWVMQYRPRQEACRVYPCVIHAWDNTPRSGQRGLVLRDPDPSAFRSVLLDALAAVEDRPESERIIFFKSWNEWAEGNHLEPDARYGTAYLQVIKEVLSPVRS